MAVVNSQDNTVSILLGARDGTFNGQVTYLTGTSPVAIVTADFNGDKKLDLAIANRGDATVSTLLGNGNGTFQSQSIIATVSSAMAIADGDFNGDGMSDLVVLDDEGSLSLLLNNEHGGFIASVLSAGSFPGGIAIGDFNNDGNLDIVVTVHPINKNTLVMFLGNGAGSFRALATTVNDLPFTVAAGDFNNDGKLDLVVNALPMNAGAPVSILVALGNGDGTFQQPAGFNFSGEFSLDPIPQVAVGDFNNDGYLDVVTIAPIENTVLLFLGQGSGSVGGPVDFTLPPSGGIAGSAASDFNGDGKLDVAVTQFNQDGNIITGFISLLPGNGDGTFQQPLSTPQVSDIGINQMVAGDFNDDGKVDIAISDTPRNGGVSVVLGNGDGTFGSLVANPAPGLNVQYMIGGDFNNDGKADLALVTLSSSNALSPVYVLLSHGDGTFQIKLVDNVPEFGSSLATGDFNHDGKLDLAVTTEQGNRSIFIYLGTGDGTFTSSTSYSTGTGSANDMKAADFNGDGEMDLAIATEQAILFFAGNGDGTFKAPVATATPFSVIRTFLGDFNGDGKPDLAITDNGDLSVSVLIGNGDGTFHTPLPFSATFYPRGFTAGDFNADGSLDLIQFSSSNPTGTPPQTASVWTSAPTVVFSAARLDFGTQNVGTSSPSRSIALTNRGTAPLKTASITTSGNFAETDNCVSTLAVGQGCTINVTFIPTANGASNGNLTLVDNADPKSQSLALAGWSGPPDFLIAATPTSQSVTPGSATSYILTLAAGGGFSGTVQLACTGVPSEAICALSKSSLALNDSSPATVKVMVTTTAPSMAILSRIGPLTSQESSTWMIGIAPIATLLLVKKRRTVATIGMSVLALILVSCGGGGSSGGGERGNSGTPPGTYSLTLSGKSGNTTHIMTIILTVK